MNKTLHIFDFDDTLIRSSATVGITHRDGSVTLLSTGEFVNYEPQRGDNFDYQQFWGYPPDAKIIIPIFSKLKEAITNHGHENVIILTSRKYIKPVAQFLNDNGINENIMIAGTGSTDPRAKAKYILKILGKNDYKRLIVYEDNLQNIREIHEMISKKANEVEVQVNHVSHRDDKVKVQPPGAGIVVTKVIDGKRLVLGLKIGDIYDIPKGQIDPNESTLGCALRETNEETGITKLKFSWGKKPINAEHLTLYVAETSDDATITPNPVTGKLEHDSAHWVSWKELVRHCKPYLRSAILAAQNMCQTR